MNDFKVAMRYSNMRVKHNCIHFDQELFGVNCNISKHHFVAATLQFQCFYYPLQNDEDIQKLCLQSQLRFEATILQLQHVHDIVIVLTVAGIVPFQYGHYKIDQD